MIIPSGLISLYNSTMDDMLNHDIFGSNCTLYYEGKKESCPYCSFQFGSGQFSGSVFDHGGMAGNHCVYCNDQGYKISEVTEIIRLRCYFDSKDWRKVGDFGSVQLQDMDLMTIGKINNLPKINKCKKMRTPDRFQLPLYFSLASTPVPWGFTKNQYFSCFWKHG